MNIRLITNRNEWFFNDDACTRVGNAFGQIPQTRWVPHVRQLSRSYFFKNVLTSVYRFTRNGGPVHWIHENYACPNCKRDVDLEDALHLDCCTNKPSENFCRPDNNRTINSSISSDNNINWGCERYRFIVGLDEMVLSAEMGLYRKFQVANHTPYDCVGLEDFRLEKSK